MPITKPTIPMNFNSNRAVPFEIPEVSYGFQEAKGLLKLTKEGIELEFEVKDAILGFMSSGIKNVTIPYSKLESITYKKGWIGAKAILEGTSMRVFDDIPGTDVANCTLKFKRKHRDEAEKLISKARVALSEYRLDQLEGDGAEE